jgi:Ser/Thr protein kinase RdoA (MazF antagonist)
MIHFDYSDGNYMIDFDTGQITVFDFDNLCFCWYMYDLANLWAHGVGWIQFEKDAGKRQKFMDDYFKTVLTGYRTETRIENLMLDKLPLFIKVTLMENIIDAFEVMRNNGEEPECDKNMEDVFLKLNEQYPPF